MEFSDRFLRESLPETRDELATLEFQLSNAVDSMNITEQDAFAMILPQPRHIKVFGLLETAITDTPFFDKIFKIIGDAIHDHKKITLLVMPVACDEHDFWSFYTSNPAFRSLSQHAENKKVEIVWVQSSEIKELECSVHHSEDSVDICLAYDYECDESQPHFEYIDLCELDGLLRKKSGGNSKYNSMTREYERKVDFDASTVLMLIHTILCLIPE